MIELRNKQRETRTYLWHLLGWHAVLGLLGSLCIYFWFSLSLVASWLWGLGISMLYWIVLTGQLKKQAQLAAGQIKWAVRQALVFRLLLVIALVVIGGKLLYISLFPMLLAVVLSRGLPYVEYIVDSSRHPQRWQLKQ